MFGNEEEQLRALTDIVNFNEGWFIVYTNQDHNYGDVLHESCFPKGSPRCVVIGEATETEARRECDFAKMTFSPAKHYYKVMAD